MTADSLKATSDVRSAALQRLPTLGDGRLIHVDWHKIQRPVQFEITQATRDALQAWIKQVALKPGDFLFPSRLHESPHLAPDSGR